MKRALYLPVLIVFVASSISCERPSERFRGNSRIEDRVIDRANLLSPTQEETIFKSIQDLEKTVGSQIAIITIASLDGVAIEQYSISKLEEMSLGRKFYKDGVLIVVAYQDREARIEVGYGLEKILKDEVAAKILREQMIPKFKEQNAYKGIYESVRTIKDLIEDNENLVGQRP
jgi:uncharacterized membrane protein YgcG